MDIAHLRRQHESLARLAGLLLRAIAAEDRRPVAGLRWQLARELLAHLAMEDKCLYPRLTRDGTDRAGEVAARFRQEMGGLSATFSIYMAHWTDQRIARDWSGFCKETRIVLTRLRDRIDRENDELYPLIGTDRTASAA